MPSSIKRLSLVRLRQDLSRELCLSRWLGAHAEVVRRLPGVVEYTVDVAKDDPGARCWDAVATLRFADRAALERFQSDTDLQRQLVETRLEFADAVDAFLVDEHKIIAPAAARDVRDRARSTP